MFASDAISNCQHSILGFHEQLPLLESLFQRRRHISLDYKYSSKNFFYAQKWSSGIIFFNELFIFGIMGVVSFEGLLRYGGLKFNQFCFWWDGFQQSGALEHPVVLIW